MKPSELDKANGKYEEDWKPEVGQECEFNLVKWPKDRWAKTTPNYLGCDVTVLQTEFGEHPYMRCEVTFRPIQSAADKYRGEQIERVTDALLNCGAEAVIEEFSVDMYKQGVRVLREGEFVARKLSDEQRIEVDNMVQHYLAAGCGFIGVTDIAIHAVERAMNVEAKG